MKTNKIIQHSSSTRALHLVLALCLLGGSSQAIWVESPPVPMARLLKNVQSYLANNPRDPNGYYVLGRLQSLAYATAAKEVRAFADESRPLPELPGNLSILTPRTRKTIDKAGQAALLAAIRNYQKAAELDPRHAMSWLGLGWVLEDGATFAPLVEAFPKVKRAADKTASWQAHALAAYRQAYQLTVAQDLKLEGLGPGANAAISLEAGNGIIRLLGKRKLTAAEKEEIIRIQKTNQTIEDKPRAVTPIIFPLQKTAPLSALLKQNSPVRFDLAGDGQPSWWPWVLPAVGILVWNPSGDGRITSGLQLFGSVTWWIAWRNGYEPLALLDDDGDGWLRDGELQGLAVWRDANSNGVSEAGEVLSLTQVGIVRLAVHPFGLSEQVPYHPYGIRLQDGRSLPTYDWTPTEAQPMRRLNCD